MFLGTVSYEYGLYDHLELNENFDIVFSNGFGNNKPTMSIPFDINGCNVTIGDQKLTLTTPLPQDPRQNPFLLKEMLDNLKKSTRTRFVSRLKRYSGGFGLFKLFHLPVEGGLEADNSILLVLDPNPEKEGAEVIASSKNGELLYTDVYNEYNCHVQKALFLLKDGETCRTIEKDPKPVCHRYKDKEDKRSLKHLFRWSQGALEFYVNRKKTSMYKFKRIEDPRFILSWTTVLEKSYKHSLYRDYFSIKGRECVREYFKIISEIENLQPH